VLRWFQFRLATLFCAVTLVAVTVDFFRHRQPLLKLAALHDARATWDRASASPQVPWMISPYATEKELILSRLQQLKSADDHTRWAAECRRAALLPWLPLASSEALTHPYMLGGIPLEPPIAEPTRR
jgi:hypothetical protein